MQFASLNLSSPLLRALADEGYTTPTPIQTQAIPPALEGRDILGCAQTGTGKTAAFALPILQRLNNAPSGDPRRHRGPRPARALILSPTRELATQIGDSFATYGRHTGLTHTVIFGGVSQRKQERALERGVDVLVATPGRLIDLMEQGFVDLSHVTHFVLDEADRMLDMGFIHPIRRIAGAVPPKRQTLLFSATMPREIMKLADSLLRNPVKVAVTPVASAVPLIEQGVYMVPRTRKQDLLHHLIHAHDIRRALVFTRTKHGADKVARKLKHAGLAADAIHGNKTQPQRERALGSFRSGRARVLVATDVAARGIDVDAITHVFNYDLPVEPESYIHRIGRTGRAGATGIAIAFCDREEREHLRAIEALTGSRVPVLENPDALAIPVVAGAADRSPGPRTGRAPRNGSGSGTGRRGTRGEHRSGRVSSSANTPRTRVRKTEVPSHPSGPSRAGTTLQAKAPVATAPTAKPSYTRGPHSQRTRRSRGR